MEKQTMLKNLIDMERRFGLIETLYQTFGTSLKVNVAFSKKSCDSSIDELNLSVRSYNALKRAGISTISDLIVRLNDGKVKNVRNLGTKSFSEIQTKILAYGFEQLSEVEKSEFFARLIESNAGC